MRTLTRAQRESVAKVYRRILQDALVDAEADLANIKTTSAFTPVRVHTSVSVPSYASFRRKAQPELCGPAVFVHYADMWLGIEPDGYTHS